MTILEPTTTTIATNIAKRRSSYRAANSREELKQLMKKHPDATENELHDMWEPIVMKRHLTKLLDDAFAHDYRILTKQQEAPEDRVAARIVQDEKIAEATAAFKEVAFRSVTFDMIMTNGKRFGDCTGDDFKWIGAGYGKLATRLGPEETASKGFVSIDDVKTFLAS